MKYLQFILKLIFLPFIFVQVSWILLENVSQWWYGDDAVCFYVHRNINSDPTINGYLYKCFV